MKKNGVLIFICLLIFLSASFSCFADDVSNKDENSKKQSENQKKNRQRPTTVVHKGKSAPTKPVEDTQQTPEYKKLGIQTPELPKPFFANTEQYGKSNYIEFGVQTENGMAYSVHAEEEVTEESIRKTIGGSVRVPMKKVKIFFKKTWGVITFVPKKISSGTVFIFKGVRNLF